MQAIKELDSLLLFNVVMPFFQLLLVVIDGVSSHPVVCRSSALGDRCTNIIIMFLRFKKLRFGTLGASVPSISDCARPAAKVEQNFTFCVGFY